ncbi:MFS transporter [Paenibacillus spongiae]|uniref:MFS transporter n=1 Tax=Paenibacillus spongiae TaxID=2909671 RepID=A0ABY5S6V2_9BACL|nr:MFS transporter [Paenibacillus spongiae]UVI28572.1 MFS transporter [Paenibacillus spongiae]
MQPGIRLRSVFARRTSSSVSPDLRLGKEARISLVIHGCFQFGASMSALFLNLYLWRLTQNLTVNGLYYILLYASVPGTFVLGGWISKRKDRMVTYRIGILLIALFYLMVVIMQEKVVNYYVLFAIFNGLSSGLYWSGFLVLQYDVSTDTNRIRYLAINMIVFNFAGLVGPALAGYVIQRSSGLQGYIFIFILAFLMFLIAAVVSFRIRTVDTHHRAYHLNLMGLVMRKNRRWFKGLIAFFVLGLFQGVMLFLPGILLYGAVGREDWVGYLGVFFSALTVATGYVISRKARQENVRKYMLASSTGTLLGASFLLIEVQLWSVLIFMILFSICNPLAINTLTSYYYRLMGTLPLKGQLREESVAMREVFLNTGRVISIASLIILSQDLQSYWLPVVLVGSAALQYTLLALMKEQAQAPR